MIGKTSVLKVEQREDWYDPAIGSVRKSSPIQVAWDLELIQDYIDSEITRRVDKEISQIKKKIERDQKISIRSISNNNAEEEITLLIKKRKDIGETTIDDLDIVEELALPIEQVDLILHKLSERGLVNERSR